MGRDGVDGYFSHEADSNRNGVDEHRGPAGTSEVVERDAEVAYRDAGMASMVAYALLQPLELPSPAG